MFHISMLTEKINVSPSLLCVFVLILVWECAYKSSKAYRNCIKDISVNLWIIYVMIIYIAFNILPFAVRFLVKD